MLDRTTLDDYETWRGGVVLAPVDLSVDAYIQYRESAYALLRVKRVLHELAIAHPTTEWIGDVLAGLHDDELETT